MADPRDNIKDDDRKEKSIASYIIFCEDGYHEPAYFKSFELGSRLMISTIGRQGQRNQHFFNAVKKCKEDGLLEVVDGVHKIKEGITENIWCVFDRDENVNQSNTKERDDFDFSTSIKNATDAGLKVAWSNDSFELWVLLHFETGSSGTKLFQSNIYARLTDFFTNLPQKSDELAKIIGVDSFRYEKHLKPKFSQHVLPLLNERMNIALDNALPLEAFFESNVSFHDRNPCTMVHHLVRELLAFQTQ